VNSQCSKCGEIDTNVQWHKSTYECLYKQQDRRDWPYDGGEHLHRTCRTCGYTWADPVTDTPTPPATVESTSPGPHPGGIAQFQDEDR